MSHFISFDKSNAKNHIDLILATPGLIDFWTFQEPGGQPRASFGPGHHFLREVGGVVQRVEIPGGAPFGDFCAVLTDGVRLEVPRKEAGQLNIHGPTAQVTVVAWIHRDSVEPANRVQGIAGIWREADHTRQYALFLNIQQNASVPGEVTFDKVSAHISGTGGATPGYPWCFEVAQGGTVVPANQWACIGMTYDSEKIRSYFDGKFDEHPGWNPYAHKGGIYDAGEAGADFVVGQTDVSKPKTNNQFFGRIGGLAVFNRALSEAEMKRVCTAV